MRYWLLEPNLLREVRAAMSLRRNHTELAAARAEFIRARASASDSKGPRCLTIVDGVAQISVHGVLTKEPDFWLWVFDIPNTSYDDMTSAIAAVERDPTVQRVVFSVDSGGGEVAGLFELLDTMRAMQKPRSATAGTAASAAFAVASNAGPITASSHASSFGSVGIVASYYVDDDTVEITSTEAPDKRPDVTTDEGKAVVRAYLDQLHQLFAENIAAGRGTTVDAVNADFGRGGMMLAAEAMQRGMIDAVVGQRPLEQKATGRTRAEECAPTVPSVPTPAPEAQQSATEQGAAQEKPMDLKTLRAQHPEIYEAAVQEGVSKEKKRVSALLKIGKSCGAMDVAIAAINDDKSVLDEDVHADFLSARLSKHETQALATDGAAVAAALPTAPAASAAPNRDIGDEVADAMGLPAAKPDATIVKVGW